MEDFEKCPICGKEITTDSIGFLTIDVNCETCGDYRIAPEAISALQNSPKYNSKKYILSAVLREANENGRKIRVSTKNIQEILDSASIPDGPWETIDRILLYVYRKGETAAFYVPFTGKDYPIVYAKDYDEYRYFWEQAISLGYLEVGARTDIDYDCRLTLKGWERVNELRKKVQESRQVFVAMWFKDEVKDAWTKAIKPVLEETGYKPIRLDDIEHNEKVDDKIIADIRKSGLLIADLTGNNHGVYFEAGLAVGLGIPVIWTCREDHLEKIHFDTRQYNYIVWKNPEELREKLKNRIEATMPVITKK